MTSTSHFLIGACLGEALVPLAMGVLMDHLGPGAFGWFLLATTCLMAALFAQLLALGRRGSSRSRSSRSSSSSSSSSSSKASGGGKGEEEADAAAAVEMAAAAAAVAASGGGAKDLEAGGEPPAVSA